MSDAETRMMWEPGDIVITKRPFAEGLRLLAEWDEALHPRNAIGEWATTRTGRRERRRGERNEERSARTAAQRGGLQVVGSGRHWVIHDTNAPMSAPGRQYEQRLPGQEFKTRREAEERANQLAKERAIDTSAEQIVHLLTLNHWSSADSIAKGEMTDLERNARDGYARQLAQASGLTEAQARDKIKAAAQRLRMAEWDPLKHKRGWHGHWVRNDGGPEASLTLEQLTNFEQKDLAPRGISRETMAAHLDELWEAAKHTGSMGEGLGWYHQANRSVTEIARRHNVSVRQAAAITAALSPQTEWGRNLKMTDRLLDMLKHDPSLTGAGASGADTAGKIGQTKQNLDLAIRLARGEDPAKILTGPKRRSFYANIIAPNIEGPVTVDGHMAHAMMIGVPQSQRLQITGRTTRAKGKETPIGYAYLADIIRERALAAGVSPADYQAVVWTEYNRTGGAYGHGNVRGATAAAQKRRQ